MISCSLNYRPKKRKRKITKSEGNESEEKLDEEVTKPDLEVLLNLFKLLL